MANGKRMIVVVEKVEDLEKVSAGNFIRINHGLELVINENPKSDGEIKTFRRNGREIETLTYNFDSLKPTTCGALNDHKSYNYADNLLGEAGL